MLLPHSILEKHSLLSARRPQGHSRPYLRFPGFIITSWHRFFFVNCPKVQKRVGSGHFLGNVFSQFCTALGTRDATVEAYWHVVEPGHGEGLVDGEGAVIFRINWIFSPPLILTPLSQLLCGSIPRFPSPVAVFTSSCSILAFKWSQGLASNSLHMKCATTLCIFHVNFIFSCLCFSTL